jgi:site-specific DNA recombinase
MRTAVYIRVSTEEQAKEGFSIAAQREKLLAYVHSQGWSLVDTYADEGFSAKNTARPALKRLLAEIRNGGIDVVLVYRLDRLTRSVLDLYQLLQEFERYGVRFKSCTEVYDTTTAIGRLFITLVAALAQWERENLAERVKLGMGQMVRERKRPGGPPPFGYELRQGKLIVHPQEAEVVRRIFRQYLSGRRPGQIAEELNRLGYRGKAGGKWTSGTVSHLLKNHVYYGALRWNYAEAGQRQNSPEDWIVIEEAHPPIVDAETFANVQRMMMTKRGKHPRAAASDFIFSGILYCACCGAPMYGKTVQTRNASGKRYVNRYYLCKNKRAGTCSAASIREDTLEESVVKLLLSFDSDLHEAARLASRLPAEEQGSRQDQLRRLEQQRLRWETAYGEGLITLERYRQKLAELAEAEQAFAASVNGDTPQLPPDRQTELLTDLSRIWDCANRAERKQLVTCLLARLEAEACPPVEPGQHRAVRLTRVQFH